MKSQRRAFTPEFKDEAVKLVVNTGRPIATVAREFGIAAQYWMHSVAKLLDGQLTPFKTLTL
jgi:transposase-like protein